MKTELLSQFAYLIESMAGDFVFTDKNKEIFLKGRKFLYDEIDRRSEMKRDHAFIADIVKYEVQKALQDSIQTLERRGSSSDDR